MEIYIIYFILIPVIAGIIMNGIIYTFKLYPKIHQEVNVFVPGYIIGIIWIVLLAILGYVNYLLYIIDNKINFGVLFNIILSLFLISYPILNSLSKNSYILLYNIIALILSFTFTLIVILYSKYKFIYLIPLLIWLSYINIIYTFNISKNNLKIQK
jgi:tryptophan-rich sensory protein